MTNPTKRCCYSRRLKKSYSNNGVKGLISQKRDKPSNRKYPDFVKELALAYIRESYADFKPTFACEKLRENHVLSV
jgi:hypothetical protein